MSTCSARRTAARRPGILSRASRRSRGPSTTTSFRATACQLPLRAFRRRHDQWRRHNDIIDGGDGADLLDGGAGNDRIYAADETVLSNDIIVGGSGTGDTVDYFGASGGVSVDLTANTSGGAAAGDTFTAVENVNGYYYGDTLRPAANGYAFGDRGNDFIFDSTGTEHLRGGRDTDYLSDNQFGEDGLRDIFILENGLGADNIAGFNSGSNANSDRFWLPEDMFSGLSHNAQGVLAAGYFINKAGDHNATAAHAQLIYQGDSHAIWFDQDGTGGGAAVKIAALAFGPGDPSER